MKLGLLIPQFPTQTHVAMWRVGDALRRLGHPVEVLSTRRPAGETARHGFLVEESQRTFYAWPPRVLGVAAQALTSPLGVARCVGYALGLAESSVGERVRTLVKVLPAALGLARHARRRKLDHLIVHSCADAAHLAAMTHRLTRLPYTLRLGGDLDVYGKDHAAKMRDATLVVPAANNNRDEVRERIGLPDERLLVSTLGVDIERFVPPKHGRGDDVGTVRLVSVARLNPTKGHADTLAALRRVVDGGVDATLTLAGAGPDHDALVAEVERLGLADRVTLHGPADEAQVIALLQQSDAFVLASFGKGEASPVAVIEAMACGCVPVCSRIGGTPDMVDDGVDGLLFDQRDTETLARHLADLARDPERRRRLGDAARAKAEAEWDCRAVAQRIVERIDALVSGGVVRSERQSVTALVIAEQANPEQVSVPLVGWSLARALAGVADAHLVTQVRNREAILRAGLEEGRDFTCIDSEAVAAPVHRLSQWLGGRGGKGWTTRMATKALAYPYFERLVWRKFGGAIRGGKYDVVHRVTPLSPTLPSSLAKRCRAAGVPFVWGPINGGVAWPREFDAARRAEREWLSYLRGAYRLLPGYRATREHCHTILVGSTATRDQMPARWRGKCVYLPENAIDPARFGVRRTRSFVGNEEQGPVRLVFVGRLVPYKGADMLLMAAAELVREGAVTVTILGDGPERAKLAAIVEQEKIGHGVEMPGWVEHDRMQHRLAEHDVLAFPSVREFGGGVVLEAMAVGLVPVIVDYAGPAELVDETTGYKVPMAARPRVVEALRQTLRSIVADPAALEPKAEAAWRHAHTNFTWAAKAEQVRAVYDHAIGRRADRPDFGTPLPPPPEDEPAAARDGARALGGAA
ncbi:MAG: glycosyltransferase [Planctomycetota bacterium]